MKQFALVAAILIALFAMACGGDDDDDGGGDDTTPTATATATPTESGGGEVDTGDDAAAGDDDGASMDAEGGTAVVTIGDTTYEFDVEGSLAVCISLGGALGAVGPAADGSGASLDLDLPPEDWESRTDEGWEAPYVRVTDGDTDWRAGGSIIEDEIAGGRIEEGTSQVDTYSIDGASASGTATFIDFGFGQSAPEPVSGTFEVSCG